MSVPWLSGELFPHWNVKPICSPPFKEFRTVSFDCKRWKKPPHNRMQLQLIKSGATRTKLRKKLWRWKPGRHLQAEAGAHWNSNWKNAIRKRRTDPHLLIGL